MTYLYGLLTVLLTFLPLQSPTATPPGQAYDKTSATLARLDRFVVKEGVATFTFPRPRYSLAWMKDNLPGDMASVTATLTNGPQLDAHGDLATGTAFLVRASADEISGWHFPTSGRDAYTVFFYANLEVSQRLLDPEVATVTGRLRWDPRADRYFLSMELLHREGAAGDLATDLKITDLPLTFSEEDGFTGIGEMKVYERVYAAQASVSADSVKHESTWRVTTSDRAVSFALTARAR